MSAKQNGERKINIIVIVIWIVENLNEMKIKIPFSTTESYNIHHYHGLALKNCDSKMMMMMMMRKNSDFIVEKKTLI